MYIIVRACWNLCNGKYGINPPEVKIECWEGMKIRDVKERVGSDTRLWINGSPVGPHKIFFKYNDDYMENNVLVADYYLNQGTKIYAGLN